MVPRCGESLGSVRVRVGTTTVARDLVGRDVRRGVGVKNDEFEESSHRLGSSF